MDMPAFRPEVYWSLYDRFVMGSFNDGLLNASLSEQLRLHPESRLIKNTERQWSKILGWIALCDRQFFDQETGKLVFSITMGDVVFPRFNTAVILTRIPKTETDLSDLIYGGTSKGVFVPVFNIRALEKAMILKLERACSFNMGCLKEFELAATLKMASSLPSQFPPGFKQPGAVNLLSRREE